MPGEKSSNGPSGGEADSCPRPWWVSPSLHRLVFLPLGHLSSTVLQLGPLAPHQAWSQPPDHLNTAPKSGLEGENHKMRHQYGEKTNDNSQQGTEGHRAETALLSTTHTHMCAHTHIYTHTHAHTWPCEQGPNPQTSGNYHLGRSQRSA